MKILRKLSHIFSLRKLLGPGNPFPDLVLVPQHGRTVRILVDRNLSGKSVPAPVFRPERQQLRLVEVDGENDAGKLCGETGPVESLEPEDLAPEGGLDDDRRVEVELADGMDLEKCQKL